MDPDVTFGVELRRLLDTFHPGDFRKDLDEEVGVVEEFEGAARMAFGEHLGQLFADALAADGVDAGGELAHGGESGGFDLESEAGGEADGAKQAKLVFFEALFGSADGANDAGIEIVEAADVVEQTCADGGRLLIWGGIG